MPELDKLEIKLQANATKANDAIDKLVLKLDRLSTSLGKINGSSLNGIANGVSRLSGSMQDMNAIKTADFTRLVKNVSKLGTLDVQGLNNSSNAIFSMARAFSALSGVSSNAQQVGVLASNLSKLGYKSIATATANIPLLANALNQLMVTLSTAPQVSQSVIDMTNALANLAAQGSKVGTSTKSLIGGLNRTNSATNRARKGVLSLAAAFGKFYASYFFVIRGLKKLWESIESTADYIEAYNYFDVTVGKISASWDKQWADAAGKNAEAYIDNFKVNLEKLSGLKIDVDDEGFGLLSTTGMKNLGLNIQEVTQYASQLLSVTNSIGQTAEVSVMAASAFSKLGADMASLFNVDYSDVMKNLQSGLIGQSRALYKYGIDITNATLQTKAYELGIDKAVSEMTQSEKQQLRMIAILEQSRVAWGDLANTINSPSNMIRQFKNNLKEAGIVLGQLFIPLLETVMPLLNGFTIAVKEFLVNLAGVMGIELDLSSFGQGYTEIEDGLGDIDEVLDDVTASAKKAKTALRGFDELKVVNTADQTTNADAASGTVDLTEAIRKATEEYEKAWAEAYEQMEAKAQKVADGVYKMFAPIKKLFSDIKIGDWFEVGTSVENLTNGIFDFLSNAIHKVNWEKVGSSIGDFLSAVNWAEVMSKVGDIAYEALRSAIFVWKESFKKDPITTLTITFGAFAWKLGARPLTQGLFINSLASKIGLAGAFGSGFSTTISAVLIIGWTFKHLIRDEDSFLRNALDKYALNDEDRKKYKEFDNFTWLETLKKNLEETKKGWGGTIDFFKTLPNEIKNALSYFDKELLSPFRKTFNQTMEDTFGAWAGVTLPEAFNALKKWYNQDVKTIFSKDKWNFGGIKEGITSSFDNAIESVKQLWNKFAERLNDKLSFEIEPIAMFGKQITSGTTITLGKVPTFATGGFPEDGLFMANHNELVGQFSNGRTAVANNSQIIAGIEAAAYNGMSRALSEHQMGATFKVEGDPKGMFRVMRQEDREYFNRTGRPAFSF